MGRLKGSKDLKPRKKRIEPKVTAKALRKKSYSRKKKKIHPIKDDYLDLTKEENKIVVDALTKELNRITDEPWRLKELLVEIKRKVKRFMLSRNNKQQRSCINIRKIENGTSSKLRWEQ